MDGVSLGLLRTRSTQQKNHADPGPSAARSGLDTALRANSLGPSVAELNTKLGGQALRTITFFALLLAGLVPVVATAADTLTKVKESGTFVIGYREDAKPFSYLDESGAPAGYSVDLCKRVAAAVKQAVGSGTITVEFKPVTAENRIDMVATGDVDIECGSSTHTIDRRQKVGFTLTTFVDGAEMLVRTGTGVGDLPDLSGRKVGVLGGTTTETGLRAALTGSLIDADVVTFDRHEAGIAALEAEQIDAYFADRTLLIGLADVAKDAGKLELSGRFYSYEPYGLMIRRDDDDFRLVADQTLASIYRSGQIWEIYQKAFPDAEASELLVALFILQGLPEK